MNDKRSKTVVVLSGFIVALALVAAGAGVFWQGEGNQFEFETLRGETVTIHGRGLYKFDSVSVVSQAIAQDVVTLVVGIPLLAVSIILYRRNSLRGKLLLAGTLGYFLYTYASYAFLAAYNSLFLIYITLFSLCLFAFVLSLMSMDVGRLPERFSARLPRRFLSVSLFLVGAFLLFAWLGRIAPTILNDSPPFGLESYTTLVIQVLDLGLVVPLAFLSGVLLLKKRPFGYLFASVALVKGFTMGTAVTAMVVGQLLAGVHTSPVEIMMFPALALFLIVATILLLKNVSENSVG